MSDDTEFAPPKNNLLRMTADIVSAYVSHNEIEILQILDIIKTVHDSLNKLMKSESETAETTARPAVNIRKSITDDYIICLEDGKKLKMLKRYLRSSYNLTPEKYRAKWGLPPDYPMVAPNYAKQRSAFAKQIGLGRTGRGGKGD
jgi:predicted transcriptional regulator